MITESISKTSEEQETTERIATTYTVILIYFNHSYTYNF